MEQGDITGFIVSLVRAALYALLGSLIAKGWLTSGQVDGIAPVLALALITIAWTLWSKIKRYYERKAASEMQPNSSLADIQTRAAEMNTAPVPEVLK